MDTNQIAKDKTAEINRIAREGVSATFELKIKRPHLHFGEAYPRQKYRPKPNKGNRPGYIKHLCGK